MTNPTSSVLFQSIPYIAVEIIISTKKQSAAFRKRYWGYSTYNVVMRKHANFLISANVKKPTCCIVWTGREGITTWKELNKQRWCNVTHSTHKLKKICISTLKYPLLLDFARNIMDIHAIRSPAMKDLNASTHLLKSSSLEQITFNNVPGKYLIITPNDNHLKTIQVPLTNFSWCAPTHRVGLYTLQALSVSTPASHVTENEIRQQYIYSESPIRSGSISYMTLSTSYVLLNKLG